MRLFTDFPVEPSGGFAVNAVLFDWFSLNPPHVTDKNSDGVTSRMNSIADDAHPDVPSATGCLAASHRCRTTEDIRRQMSDGGRSTQDA